MKSNRDGFIGLIALVVLAIACESTADAIEMATAREMFDGAMRPEVEVNTFSHYNELFPARAPRPTTFSIISL
jgi:hypothetical protein